MTARLPLTRTDLLIGLALMLTIFAVYAQVVQFEFIRADDKDYVTLNPVVQRGLTYAGIAWSLTASVAANWLPVTLISHMLDVQLFGLDSGMHHLMNVALHALATLALFLLMRRATGARWPSAFVAAVFALHPLHVESVAWISERKDVLSALFLFLALYVYVRYVEQPGLLPYLLLIAAFCLALMSKPMVVTFPFVLLLFDFWPLSRPPSMRLLWEKLPLFGLSAAACFIAYRLQASAGALQASIPLRMRFANAVMSCVTYLGQTIWPSGLAVYYPYPLSVHWPEVWLSLALILAISVSAIAIWRARPYVAVGWFWYLGTLVPVIGFVQVGTQAHADRYTYIPMVGLLIVLAWFVADFAEKLGRSNLIAAAAICCLTCAVLTARQTAFWRNPETLYSHAIEVTTDNPWANANLGEYLVTIPGRRADALDRLRTALRINPDDATANYNYGTCLLESDLSAEAIPYLETALRIRPNYASAHLNLAMSLAKVSGREEEAVEHYREGLRLAPEVAEGHRYFSELLLKLGRPIEAKAEMETAKHLRP